MHDITPNIVTYVKFLIATVLKVMPFNPKPDRGRLIIESSIGAVHLPETSQGHRDTRLQEFGLEV